MHDQLLVHGLSHLPREDLPRFISLLNGRFQHQVLLFHPICVILKDHYLAVSLGQSLRLEVHPQLKFLHLLDNFLFGIGCSSILSMQLPLLFLVLSSELLQELVILKD